MKILDESNFETVISNGNWLVIFWVAWCGPCIDHEYLENFQKSNSDIFVGSVNVDENKELAKQHSITIFPTYVFFKEGKSIQKIVGLQNEDSLQKKIKF
jgi:thioredoxin 1